MNMETSFLPMFTKDDRMQIPWMLCSHNRTPTDFFFSSKKCYLSNATFTSYSMMHFRLIERSFISDNDETSRAPKHLKDIISQQ